MDRRQLGKSESAFTLIELLTVLVILALTLSMATPMVAQLLHKNQLRREAGRLLQTMNLARTEAVMRNVPVSICPSSMAATGEPTCDGNYAGGWIIFSNPDRDRVVDAGSDQVLQIFGALPQGYQLTNRVGTRAAMELINFLPDGSSHNTRTLLVCPPAHAAVHPLSIVLNIVGRARLVRDWGQCPLA